ncbi:hypothetical protein EYV94_02465 [Puteibacter caeruleilacunae]|nr:hypothetical protein EYV94_02465 [Puteibacter caeruleilacunae]
MKNKINIILSLFVIGLCLSVSSTAQNYLKKKINFQVTNQSTETTMFILEKLVGFNFSYDALDIDPSRMVSFSGKQRRLKDILDELFQDRFTYKVIGSHVILQAKDKNAMGNKMWLLSGIITDSSGNPLENAIVYEINRQALFITNPDGKYMLRLTGEETLGINFSCKGYKDTVVYVQPAKDKRMDIMLNPWQPIVRERPVMLASLSPKSINWAYTNKTLGDFGLVNMMVPQKALYVSNNLNVEEVRFVQVSFLPSWGTNRLANGLVTNKFSFNIIAGYSAKVNGVEIGSVANITRKSINGVQVSGAVNVVGENVNGVQVAGAVNTILGNMHGVQTSGAVNQVKGDIKGLQIAGAVNIAAAKSMDTLKTKGWNGQFSGGINLHGGEQMNFQASGIYNQANSIDGVQITGGINRVRGTTNGIQAAGLYNRTHKLRGIQIGLINVADTIDDGFPIGLINIIRNGYQVLEFSTDECFYINAAYKTGGKKFYSFLKIGAGKYLNAAYGMGITSNPQRNFSVNIDVSGSALFNTDSDYDVFAGDLVRAQLGLNFKLTDKATLSTGPSFNFCSPDKEQDTVANPSLSSKNNIFYGNYYLDKAVNTRKDKYWLGWQLGIRF